MARELVDGLKSDLLARDHSYWKKIGHEDLISFDDAARRALKDTRPSSLLVTTYEKMVGAISKSPENKIDGEE